MRSKSPGGEKFKLSKHTSKRQEMTGRAKEMKDHWYSKHFIKIQINKGRPENHPITLQTTLFLFFPNLTIDDAMTYCLALSIFSVYVP